MEVTAFIAAQLEDDAGRRRVVRHGRSARFKPASGRSRCAAPGCATAGVQERPARSRREELLPWLYLKGISTGDFTEALAALLGPDASGAFGLDDHALEGCLARRAGALGKARPLGPALSLFLGRRDLFPAPDGATSNASWSSSAPKEAASRLLTIADGYRESAQSWRELLLDWARPWRPSWPSETERSASGRHCVHGNARTALGCTRPFRTRCPSPSKPRPSGTCEDIWLAETKDRA